MPCLLFPIIYRILSYFSIILIFKHFCLLYYSNIFQVGFNDIYDSFSLFQNLILYINYKWSTGSKYKLVFVFVKNVSSLRQKKWRNILMITLDESLEDKILSYASFYPKYSDFRKQLMYNKLYTRANDIISRYV